MSGSACDCVSVCPCLYVCVNLLTIGVEDVWECLWVKLLVSIGL